jgi:uncharacterized zinc-type alcohol dehydrogenase-like protein
MIKVTGYAARHSFSRLKPYEFEREEARANEVEIDILYCGVGHSDIHQVRNKWSDTVYPCIPGHEIVGRVTRTGAAVARHAIGDLVGVGAMIDSCGRCAPCQCGDQNYCESPNGWLATYNGPLLAGNEDGGGNIYGRDNTFGGYSSMMVVKEDFVLTIPPQLNPAAAAPLLCAGAAGWSALRHWGVKPRDRVGIIGMGGLGHIAAMLARAMGAEVTIFTSTHDKIGDAERLGFTAIMGDDLIAMRPLRASFDFMLSTIPEKHDVNGFIELLKRDSVLCVLGALEPLAPVDHMAVALRRRAVAGSLISNLAETQQVLDFCAQHDIAPEIELIPIQDINEAFRKVEKGEVKFRYVIDMASLRPDMHA